MKRKESLNYLKILFGKIIENSFKKNEGNKTGKVKKRYLRSLKKEQDSLQDQY